MECKYYDIENNNKELGNEMDLDRYLIEHRDSFISMLDKIDLTLRTDSKLKDAATQNDVDRFITSMDVEASDVQKHLKVDITNLWTRYDAEGKKLNTSPDVYEYNWIANYKKEHSETSDEIAKKAYADFKLNSPNYANIGTAVGKALEFYMNATLSNPEEKKAWVNQQLKAWIGNKPLFNSIAGNNNFYNTVYDAIDSLVSFIKDEFGDDCIIRLETSVATSDTSNELLSILTQIAKLSDPSANVNTLLGRTDITVITKSGDVHTIEMKTKGAAAWKDVYLADLKSYKYQVATYDLIRRQRKINSTPYLLLMTRAEDGSIRFNGKESSFLRVGQGEKEYVLAQTHIPIHEEVQLESTDASNKIMGSIFGLSSGVARSIETLQRDVDWWMSPENTIIKHVTPDMKDLYEVKKHRFYYTEWRNGQSTTKSAVTREELRGDMTAYVQYLNERSANSLLSFAKDFRYVSSINDLQELLARNGYNKSAVDTMSNHLMKYLDGWVLDDNLALISNGFLLFRKGGRCEIVMFNETRSLNEMHKFDNIKNGTTILGAIYGDSEAGSGNTQILSAKYGNLMLMKAMSIVSEMPLLFKNEKISSISAINPRFGEVINTVTNAKLNDNWRMLAHKFKRLNLKLVDSCFMDDAEAAVNRAKDWVALLENDTISNANGALWKINTNFATLNFDSTVIAEGRKQIIDMIKMLESNRVFGGKYSDQMDYRAKRALIELKTALLALNGYSISPENDVASFLDQGFNIAGSLMTPFYRSNSANLREFSKIATAFHYKLTEEVQKVTTPFQIKLNKALKADPNYNSAIGGEYVMSQKWFVKDETGKIHKDFRVIPPYSPQFPGTKEEAELLDYVLETFAKWKYRGRPYDELKAIPTSSYYQMPIYESGFLESIDSSDNKIQATISLTSKKVKRVINVSKELLYGRDNDVVGFDDPSVLNADETPDPFNDTNREDLIKQYGTDVFTKNIDDIFLFTTATAVKNQLSHDMLPLLTAYRELIHFMNVENKAEMKDIENAIIRYMGIVIFDKAGVSDSGANLALHAVLQVFRQVFSVMTLGLSLKALTRDTFSSNLRTAISLLNGSDKSMGITSNEFFTAYADVCKNGDALFTSSGFLNQLNLIHRMANMSYREIAGQLKTNKFALKNIDQSFLFMTSTSSDFVHRMGLLVAYLKKIGAYDAYVMNQDGMVEYDMEKDDRFKILFKYQFGVLVVPESDQKEYYKARSIYLDSLSKWQVSHPNLKYGDKLPLALDPQQEANIKSLSNNLYGAYDKEEQALVHSTLIGGAFLQFKTYGMSRLIDWWRRPGQINIAESKVMKDDNGKDLYIIQTSEEEFNETGIRTKIVTFDEVPADQITTAKPFKMEMGAIDEGRLQSTYALLAAAYKAYYGTGDEQRQAEEMLREKLKDPMTRENIFRAFADILMSLLIQGALMIIYPEEVRTNMSQQDWWTRWTHAVLSGVAQDGPVWEVFNSVWGGGEIPVIAGMARFASSAMGVIHGNDFLPALANSFGATRELSAMLKDL